MRRMRGILAVLLAVLAIALMPTRAYAGIGPSPTEDEIFINGTSLADQSVSGVSYDFSKGVLTLTNYKGGPIKVEPSSGRSEGDQAIDLTIVLVGNNTITSKGGNDAPAIDISGEGTSWTRTLTITSTSGGTLTINRTFKQGHAEDIFFDGIIVSGDVTIGDRARVTINMNAGDVSSIKNSSGVGVIAAGITTNSGCVYVEDQALLSITIKGEGACHAAGVMTSFGGLHISTASKVTIDLTGISVTGAEAPNDANYPGKTVGVDANNPEALIPISIQVSPLVIIKADFVYHIVTPNKLDNPSFPKYTYRKVAGQYTNTHYYKFTIATSVNDLTVSFTPPSAADSVYWGGHIKPVVTVEDEGMPLEEMRDYALTFKPDNINPGTVTVYIEGMGSYKGTRKVGTFEITQPFTDVDTSTYHYKDILWLYANHISEGWKMGDGTREYRPMEDVARCDMAAFLYRLAGEPSFTPSAADKAKFSDVDSTTPHCNEIWWLASTGISTGFEDGTFRPYEPIARCDMAAFLYRLAGSPSFTPTAAQMKAFSDIDSETPHCNEVWWLASTGVSTGFEDGTFQPYANIARCDMAAFMHRMDSKSLIKTSW